MNADAAKSATPAENRRERKRPQRAATREVVWKGNGLFAVAVPEKCPIHAGEYIGHRYAQLRNEFVVSGLGQYVQTYLHESPAASIADALGKTVPCRLEIVRLTYPDKRVRYDLNFFTAIGRYDRTVSVERKAPIGVAEVARVKLPKDAGVIFIGKK